jgi:hypothetical protein
MSELRTNLLSNAAGTGPAELHKQSAAKAMCSIRYSAGVPNVGKSLNVSSATDAGVGNASINLTSAMADTTYITAASGQQVGSGRSLSSANPSSASLVQFYMFSEGGTAFADDNHSFVLHGDLA